MRRAAAKRPLLHRVGDVVRNGGVESLALFERRNQLTINRLGQDLLHRRKIEHVFRESMNKFLSKVRCTFGNFGHGLGGVGNREWGVVFLPGALRQLLITYNLSVLIILSMEKGGESMRNAECVMRNWAFEERLPKVF